MEKVTSILSRKHHSFNHVLPGTNLRDALFRMNCENADYLIVMDEDDRYLGILSDHDITSKAMFGRKPIENILVAEVMNTRLPVVDADDTVERCIRLMRQFKVRYLPVYDNFSFCGIVTSDDILQEAINNRAEIFDDGEPVF
jgi:CBS domain-containing protein